MATFGVGFALHPDESHTLDDNEFRPHFDLHFDLLDQCALKTTGIFRRLPLVDVHPLYHMEMG